MASNSAPARPRLLKDLNERAVLETIRTRAPISRAEISRRAGISKPTVSLALQALLDAGLVRDAEPSEDGPRYGATFFEPDPEAATVLGLDLGARYLRGAISDLSGAVRARQDVELADADARVVLDAAAELKDRLLEESGLPADRLDGGVVGVPGVVGAASGRVELAENIHGLEGMEVADELRRHLGMTVAVENDVNLAALGERAKGIARESEDFAFLSIGTGLGAGLVLRGELHRGHHGAAGEVDYALGSGVERSVDPCAEALSAYVAELARTGEYDTQLTPPYVVPAVFDAARGGDALANAAVAEEARRIALHIAPIAAVADVGLVVLGGGIGANGDLLLEPVRGELSGLLPYPPRVEASALGHGAVLSGALAVGLTAALENVFVNRRSTART
jgi:predicted NBD/HSP70 family sugar kinase